MMLQEVVGPSGQMAGRNVSGKRRPRGFSLVELLVVVGIIAILLAAVFAAVTKVRGSARRIECQSNLKTIGAAIHQYLVDNNDTFPEAASNKVPPQPGDFLCWQSAPFANGTATQFAIDMVGSGGIGKYIGGLDDRSPGDMRMLQCPADERLDSGGYLNNAPSAHSMYPAGYPFSYVISAFMVSGNYPDNGPDPSIIARTFSKVRDASTKIMVYEEDARTINQGVGMLEAVNSSQWTGYPIPVTGLLSCRHDIHEAPSTIPPTGEAITVVIGPLGTPPVPQVIVMNHEDSYGNVLFADGHSEFVSRRFAHSKAHYAPDPDAPLLALLP
jgi:prepilin-type N-terminal cleavage/methylation domain-containing protein/prepilin-type processing-associated H-X9-DG protein